MYSLYISEGFVAFETHDYFFGKIIFDEETF